MLALSLHACRSMLWRCASLTFLPTPDGKMALYVAKLMLCKMAHKDWTPLDRQWITSQAKRVRAAMPAACHFGCEGILDASGALQMPERLRTTESSSAGTEKEEGQLNFDVTLSAAVADATLATLLAAGQAAAAIPESELLLVGVKLDAPVDEDHADADSLAGFDEEEINASVHVHVQLRLSDHQHRLGTLVQQTGQDGAVCVLALDHDSVLADVSKLRIWLAGLLGLKWPDKDPDEFRCGYRTSIIKGVQLRG